MPVALRLLSPELTFDPLWGEKYVKTHRWRFSCENLIFFVFKCDFFYVIYKWSNQYHILFEANTRYFKWAVNITLPSGGSLLSMCTTFQWKKMFVCYHDFRSAFAYHAVPRKANHCGPSDSTGMFTNQQVSSSVWFSCMEWKARPHSCVRWSGSGGRSEHAEGEDFFQ